MGERVKWIDIMLSGSNSQAVKRVHDNKTLLTSLFPTNAAAVTGLMKSDAVTVYAEDCSVLNMSNLIAALRRWTVIV